MEDFSLNSDSVSSHLGIEDGEGSRSEADRTTKKVRFKDGFGMEETNMMIDPDSSPKLTWKDKFLGVNFEVNNEVKLNPFTVIVRTILSLPCYLYKKKIIEEIRGTIGKVVRLDLNTDTGTRGHFARLVVYINLDEPLIAQVLVNGRHQRLEYKALPTICFSCGKYGHTKKLCGSTRLDSGLEKQHLNDAPAATEGKGGTAGYWPWMVVERKNQRNSRNNIPIKTDPKGKDKLGSRFRALANMEGATDLEKELNKEDEGIVADG
ncbi:hypothetical protein J1N35_007742 [Gossypium stocksii]|uniref:CCHC-type domain-containing protein n=1 Tax=Gossypium stocksii TaxID=47602 RepID=A0A9D3W6Z5_9ROSI|nr:hypothetical protein J1N35_007742 [Gossypium stocksii]